MKNDLFSALLKNLNIIQEANLNKIATNLTAKDFAAAGLPTNGLYFVFDTETTGLNLSKEKNDIITEIAILAYDSTLKEIPQTAYHGAIKKTENLPDEKNPAKIILEIKQGLQGLIADDKVNRLIMGVFKDLRKAPSFQGGDAFKEIFKKRMSIFLQKHYPEKADELAANPRMRNLYFELRKLVSAAELRNVLKMTKFGKLTEPTEAQTENELAENSVKFVNDLMAKHPEKLSVAVAHNYPYDKMMLNQAVGRKQAQLGKANQDAKLMGIEYPFEKFIDTAQFTRKIVNKLLLATFIYFSKLYVITKDERYKAIALKIKPNTNNRMGTLAAYFKIPNLSWHTAKNDVQATAAVLKYLIALNSRVASYVTSKEINKDLIKNVQDELDKMEGGEATGSKKPDFFDAMRGDLYRKMHEKLYAEFSGVAVVKKPSGKESKDDKIEYLDMLEREFPGLGDISSFLRNSKSSGSSTTSSGGGFKPKAASTPTTSAPASTKPLTPAQIERQKETRDSLI